MSFAAQTERTYQLVTLPGRVYERPSIYRFTGYFEANVLRRRPYLRREWCTYVLQFPERVERQSDGRWRFWARVPELGGRYLRVVTLEDWTTIHNAFPDRGLDP